MRIHLRFSAVLALALLTLAVRADGVKESPYYPLDVGTTWHYTVRGFKTEDPTKDKTMIVRVAKHEKVGTDHCAFIASAIDDKLVATEQVGVRDDGLYRFARAGTPFDPPVCILKLPFNKGEVWQAKLRFKDEEVPMDFSLVEAKVTVPAGEFDAILVESKIADKRFAMNSKVWYVKGVGIVKAVDVVGNANGPNEFVAELTKVERGR